MINDECNAEGISTLIKYVVTVRGAKERRMMSGSTVGLQWVYSGSIVGL